MKIKGYKLQKVETHDTEVFIPQEPFYCFETGIRRSIRIVPNWTTWNQETYGKDEEIYELVITCVYQSFMCKIEQFKISISRIEEYYNSNTPSEVKNIVTNILINKGYNNRTKEQFEADFNSAIEQLRSVN